MEISIEGSLLAAHESRESWSETLATVVAWTLGLQKGIEVRWEPCPGCQRMPAAFIPGVNR